MTTQPNHCYELRYADGEPVDTGDGVPHFPTADEAADWASRYTVPVIGTPSVHRLDKPCVRGPVCDGCERTSLDDDSDDEIACFATPEEAQQYYQAGGWQITADTATCPDCVRAEHHTTVGYEPGVKMASWSCSCGAAGTVPHARGGMGEVAAKRLAGILAARHHTDITWRPDGMEQMEQMDGRGDRPGNTLRVYQYVTDGDGCVVVDLNTPEGEK